MGARGDRIHPPSPSNVAVTRVAARNYVTTRFVPLGKLDWKIRFFPPFYEPKSPTFSIHWGLLAVYIVRAYAYPRACKQG